MVLPVNAKPSERKVGWRNYWHMETVASRADSNHVQRVWPDKILSRPMALLSDNNVHKRLGDDMYKGKEVKVTNVTHKTKERTVWADLLEKTKDSMVYTVTRLSDQVKLGVIKLEGDKMEAHLNLEKEHVKSIDSDMFEELHDLMRVLSKENK